jgi:hypothetical protein
VDDRIFSINANGSLTTKKSVKVDLASVTIPQVVEALQMTAMALEHVSSAAARATRNFISLLRTAVFEHGGISAVHVLDLVREMLCYSRALHHRAKTDPTTDLVNANLLHQTVEFHVRQDRTQAGRAAANAISVWYRALQGTYADRPQGETKGAAKTGGGGGGGGGRAGAKPLFAQLTAAQKKICPCPEIPTLTLCTRHKSGPTRGMLNLCSDGCDKYVHKDGDVGGIKYHYCVRSGKHTVHKIA